MSQIACLAADYFSSDSIALHIDLQFVPLLDKVADGRVLQLDVQPRLVSAPTALHPPVEVFSRRFTREIFFRRLTLGIFFIDSLGLADHLLIQVQVLHKEATDALASLVVYNSYSMFQISKARVERTNEIAEIF